MDIELAYGRDGAWITVPDENLVAVVEPRWPSVLAQPQEAVAAALARPVAGPPLAALLAERIGRRDRNVGSAAWRRDWRNFRAVIIASDTTRPCPNRDILLPLVGALRLAGVPGECVSILIATGLHAPVMGAAMRKLLGEEIVADYRVVNHFGHRPVTLKHLGQTAAGSPVVLAREWVEADLRIATGVIEPHMMAGFSGGRKAICPGISGDETVRAFHAPRFIEHEHAMPGSLESNPTHEEALAVADFAPPHFIVNVTVDRNERLTGVFAGEMRATHQAGVAFLREHVCRPVREPCDILVTTNGGYPLDGSYYQCQKGLLSGVPVLKRGGTFLFAAACEDGLGQREFTDLIMRYKSLEEFTAASTAPGAAVIKDQWALTNLSKAARHAEIMFWSDKVPQSLQQKMFVTPVASLAGGLAQALAKHGPKARVTVMPWGPYVLPFIEK
ncbi:MAG: nickel-dependent lactate racemase [Planctomycetota bacterium]|nr:nickel-dependent lactate racemase [Planctomycetota bacterium]